MMWQLFNDVNLLKARWLFVRLTPLGNLLIAGRHQTCSKYDALQLHHVANMRSCKLAG
jgi:hypothetical protein